MDYRSITMEDRPWIERCRDPRKNPFTALSFTSLFTWSRDYGLEIGGDDDFFVILCKSLYQTQTVIGRAVIYGYNFI